MTGSSRELIARLFWSQTAEDARRYLYAISFLFGFNQNSRKGDPVSFINNLGIAVGFRFDQGTSGIDFSRVEPFHQGQRGSIPTYTNYCEGGVFLPVQAL